MFSRNSGRVSAYVVFCFSFLFAHVVFAAHAIGANYSSVGQPSFNCIGEHPGAELSNFEMGQVGSIAIAAAPNTPVYVQADFDEGFLPSGQNQFFNITTYLNPQSPSLVQLTAQTDSGGTAIVEIPIPNDPSLIGRSVGFQVITVEPSCLLNPMVTQAPLAASALLTAQFQSSSLPQAGELQTSDSFQIGEISFHTSSPVRYGFYVTGDLFLVKDQPFEISSVSPSPEYDFILGEPSDTCDSGAWGGQSVCTAHPDYDPQCQFYEGTGRCMYFRIRNGMALNHTQSSPQTFDSRAGGSPVQPAVSLPYLSSGPGIESLLLTISQPDEVSAYCAAQPPGNQPWTNYWGGCTWSPVSSLEIVTIIPPSAIPTGPEFRPAYPGDPLSKERYAADNMTLPDPILPPTQNAPSYQHMLRSIENPWLVTGGAERYTTMSPANNMGTYGSTITIDSGEAMLSLLRTDLNVEQRRQLLIHLVQIGIDFHAAFMKEDGVYSGTGGHSGFGRLFNTVLAGHVLGRNELSDITLSPKMETDFSPVSYSYYDNPARDFYLGVDGMPRYSPSGFASYIGWARDYAQALVDPSRNYFDCCTVSAWFTEVFAMRLLGLEAQVRDPDLFDLITRYMDEDRAYGHHSPMAMELWSLYGAPPSYRELLCSNGAENRCQSNCNATAAEYSTLSALQGFEPLPGPAIMIGETANQIDCGPGCGVSCPSGQ